MKKLNLIKGVLKQKFLFFLLSSLAVALCILIFTAIKNKASESLRSSCRAKCTDGSCSASCIGNLTASCNCSDRVVGGKKLSLPVCGCSTIFIQINEPNSGEVSDLDDTFITATKEQLNHISSVREEILKTVKPFWLANRLAKNLEIIEFALEHHQTNAYRVALENFLEDFEMIEKEKEKNE